MIDDLYKKLEFYIDNGIRTVMLEGEKGIGKTLLIKKLFDKKFGKGKWRYYSGSTMDPFIDMIGCPIKTEDKETKKDYLELVQPKDFANDEVRAIFLDEWNRSKEQVRNACLELIQFSSMNGKQFKNLEYIWGSVNPDDGEYQVDEMDPAQKDRFIVYLKLPYELSKTYFREKYPELSEAAIEWWYNLPKELRKLVSPRRLDYAMEFYKKGGDLSDVLDDKTNPEKLLNALNSGSYISRFKALQEQHSKSPSPDTENKLKDMLSDPNNFFNLKDFIIKNHISMTRFFTDENISNLLSSNDKVFEQVINNLNVKEYSSTIDSIISSNLNAKVVEKIKTHPKHIEYIFMKDEPDDPATLLLEAELHKYSTKETLYKFIEDNKDKLVGSEKTIFKMIEVNSPEYDINSDPLANHIMMSGLN